MTNMTIIPENYNNIRAEIVELLKTARSTAARNVNSIMTATYWEIGRRIVQSEQGGAARANYGDELFNLTCALAARRWWAGHDTDFLGPPVAGLDATFRVPGWIPSRLYTSPGVWGKAVRLGFLAGALLTKYQSVQLWLLPVLGIAARALWLGIRALRQRRLQSRRQ